MSSIWLPGLPAGPLEELVARIHAQIRRFASERGLDETAVTVELVDGARFALDAVVAEPGFGFLTLVPHPDESEDLPAQVVIPVGAIRRLELDAVEEERARFGFSLPGGEPSSP